MAGTIKETDNIKEAWNIEMHGFGKIDRDSCDEWEIRQIERLEERHVTAIEQVKEYELRKLKEVQEIESRLAFTRASDAYRRAMRNQVSVHHSPGTITVASPYTQVEVQAAFDDPTLVDGDTVQIPNCSVTWTGAAVWNASLENKSIIFKAQNDCTLDADGRPTSCNVNITNFCLSYTGLLAKTFRVAHMRIIGGNTTNIINVAGNSQSWRIDHNYFDTNTPTGGIARSIVINETGTTLTYGVIDHNYITNHSSDFLHWESNRNYGGGNYGWTQPLDLGGSTAVYFEDNTYSRTSYNGGIAITDANGGGRFVCRYNKITNGWFQAHDVQSNVRGMRKWEIYNNTLNFTSGCDGGHIIQLRGATGVVYNNTITHSGCTPGNIVLTNYRTYQTSGDPFDALCGSGTGNANLLATGTSLVGGCTPVSATCIKIDGSATGPTPPSGYPCRDQTGFDQSADGSQTSRPYLFWANTKNGADAPPVLGIYDVTTYCVEDRDWCHDTTTMPATCNGVATSYTAYTYPHPLTGGESASESPSESPSLSPSASQSPSQSPSASPSTGAHFILAPSTYIAAGGGTVTTNQLTAPTGKTEYTQGRIVDDSPTTQSIDIGDGHWTELEWCIQSTEHIEPGATYEFRVKVDQS